MMSSALSPPSIASSSSAVRPSRSPSMMRCFSRSSTGQAERSSLTVLTLLTSAKTSSSCCSGSYGVPSADIPRRS